MIELIGGLVIATSLCIACTRRSIPSIVYAVAIVLVFYFNPFQDWCDQVIGNRLSEGNRSLRLMNRGARVPDDVAALCRLFRCTINIGFALALSLGAMGLEWLTRTEDDTADSPPVASTREARPIRWLLLISGLVLWYFFAIQVAGVETRTVTRLVTMVAFALAAANAILTRSKFAIVFVCVAATLLWLQRWFWMEGMIAELLTTEKIRTTFTTQIVHHAFSVLTGLLVAFLVQLRLPKNVVT